ncbi:DUF4010 domain-containing protein [Glaciimonas sp. GS1]|uniref:DUF4010 domain-containing protein n=2 Tax=Glaciimonas soli TaxID=2590999 RepID=A0A843YT57_9BURK|nr:DUF4010 domain-containing protein [Glaciimonas soli]
MTDPHTIATAAQPIIQIGMSLPDAQWPYIDSLTRLGLALALGLLIGLERERRGKEAGLRTFGLVALLGGMGGLVGDNYAYLVFIMTGGLAAFLNIQRLRTHASTELTTSAAMLATCIVGILCGKGHTATPASVMVTITALLAWKDRFANFSSGLTEAEMRSALLLAILAIVIYPALPIGAIGPWHLIEPRAAWLTVILIAGIGFINYVLWKIYGARGIALAGFLGGLVNSSVTVNEMASRAKDNHPETISAAYRGILLATAAMTIRNACILFILAPTAALTAAVPFAFMLLINAAWFFMDRNATHTTDNHQVGPVELPLPFSLRAAFKYGLLFLLLHIAGVITQDSFGELGFYAVSLIGGLVSSASAVAAAASLLTGNSISAHVASTGAVIASLASVLVNMPLVLRARNRGLIIRLSLAMLSITVVGIVGSLAAARLLPLLVKEVPFLAQFY